MKNFNVNTQKLTIVVTCPNCRKSWEETIYEIPEPNMSADNVADSENSTEVEIECPECGKTLTVELYNNIYEGNVEINDVEFEIVEEIVE